tara:strand:+ start:3397 stop:5010 length:1614 start_codon:yes stop_codon:yes gene_type:complete
MKPSGVKDGTLYSQVPVTKIGDFNVSRGSMATRVNEDGFIETVGYIVGGELVTNGDFATDSDWTKGAGWTIVGGVATSDGTTSNLDQSSVLTTSVRYKATVTVSNMTIGSLSFRLGSASGDQAINITSNGIYTFYGVAGNTTLRLRSQSSFDGSVTNISVMEFASNDVPRIDYTGGGCPVLLTEPQSTNERLYSENFSVDYSLTRAIVYSDYAFDDGSGTYLISPDGTSNSTIFQDDASGGNNASQLFKAASVDVLSTYTFSVFVKKGFNDYIALRTASYSTPINGQSYFNLDLGTVISESAGHTARIEDYGNGWYRCSVTFTTDASDTTGNCFLRHSKDGVTTTVPIDGTNSVRVWGWQFEEMPYPTSYIPTVGAARSRLGDVVTGAGNASTLNDSEGVLYVEASFEQDEPSSLSRISISNGGSGERILLYKATANKEIGVIVSNGGSQFNITYTYTGSADDFFKMAIKWKENDFAFWVNGVEVATDNSGTTPVGLNELQLTGGGGTTDPFYGKTKDLQVYDVALTDLELEVLTSL